MVSSATRILAVILCVALLSGCAEQRQINELALVTAVGLDKGSTPGSIRLSVQIARPADARGQTGAPSGGTGEPVYSAEAEGNSIFEAVRNLGSFISRRVYWAHNFLIVMSEDYARNGIEDMIDFFTRNNELRMNAWVAVTPDPPEELISTVTGLEVDPGEAVDRLFRLNRVVSDAPRTNMMRLEEAFLSTTTHPVLARLTLKQRGIPNKKPEEQASLKQVELKGAAAFKENRMAGWLSPEETRGLLYFIQKPETAEVNLSGTEDDRKAAVELRRQKFNMIPSYRNGRISFNISLEVTGNIVEYTYRQKLQHMIPELESRLENVLEEDLQSVIRKAQISYRSDFLKAGDVFRNRYPAEWKAIRDWDEAFSEAEFKIKVTASITSPVLKIKDGGLK